MTEISTATGAVRADSVIPTDDNAAGPDVGRRPRRSRNPVGRRGRTDRQDRRDTRAGETALRSSASDYRVMARDAQHGDTSAKDTLAIALTGMTYEELSDEQAEIFDTVLGDMADGKITPELLVVDQGDVESTTEDTLLPEDVSGAYVPGEDGNPGTILIARVTLESGNLDDVVSEEMGEAIAEYARALGLEVHEGDAGARLRLAASGDDVASASALFEASETDTASVRFKGEIVEAEALLDIPGTDFIPDPRLPGIPGVNVPGLPLPDTADGDITIIDPHGQPKGPPAPTQAEPVAPEPVNGWLGSALVSSSVARGVSQVNSIRSHLMQSDGALDGFPANGVLSAYEIKHALSKGIGSGENGLPIPVSEQALSQLKSLVQTYGQNNPATGYYAVNEQQLTRMIQDGYLGLGVSAYAGSRHDVVVVSADPVAGATPVDASDEGIVVGRSWWSSAIHHLADAGKAVAHAVAKFGQHAIDDVHKFVRGEMDAVEAKAKGLAKTIKGFGEAVIAGGEAEVAAFDSAIGALFNSPGLEATAKQWLTKAKQTAKEAKDDTLVGLLMSLGSMTQADAVKAINQMHKYHNMIGRFLEGNPAQKKVVLGEAFAETMQRLDLTDAGDGSGDSALEKFLSGNDKARLDMVALEFNTALKLFPGAVDVAQFRIFVTAPRRLENGKHSVELRIRALDEAGWGGSIGKSGPAAADWDGGVLGLHDIVIPFEYDSVGKGVDIGDIKLSATTAGIVEVDPGVEKSITEVELEPARRELGEMRSMIEEMDHVLGDILPDDFMMRFTPGAIIPAVNAATSSIEADLEIGIGFGFNTTYNLTEIANKRGVWGALLPFATEAVGAGIGGAIGAGAGVILAGGPEDPAAIPAAMRGAHFGADIGGLVADEVGAHEFFKDETSNSFVGFTWVGGRGKYNRKAGLDPDASTGFSSRARLMQFNYDFLKEAL